jgi:GntR family transcriptional regulator
MEGIRCGDYPPGTRIPSEPQLAKDYGIGRPTVRQAIDVLVRQRLLLRRRGSGTYVRNAGSGDRSVFPGRHQFGISTPGDRRGCSNCCSPRAGSGPRHAENPVCRGAAFFLSRLNRVDDAPVLIGRDLSAPGAVQGPRPIDLAGRSLSQVVESSFYMRPTGGRQTFRIGNLDADRAKGIMGVNDRTPVLAVHRYLEFQAGGQRRFFDTLLQHGNLCFSQQIGGLAMIKRGYFGKFRGRVSARDPGCHLR